MAKAKDYMLIDEALDLSEGEEREPPKKQHKKGEGRRAFTQMNSNTKVMPSTPMLHSTQQSLL